jgi:hypothetical protein
MSLDGRDITEALNRYAEGVVMSATDLDRMQHDLRGRLQRPRRPRGRLLVAVAAALLLVAAILGATAWSRRPATPVPATPQSLGSLTGMWKFTNWSTTTMFLIRADGTTTEYPNPRTFVRGTGEGSFHVTSDGQHIRVDGTDDQGRPCRTDVPILSQSDGFLAQGPQTLTGPGCPSASQPESMLTRLSPASAAAGNLPVSTEEPAMPVADPVQLTGVWLLQGTGLVLAVDEKSGPAQYVLAGRDVDPAPDGGGSVSIDPQTGVVLGGAACGDAALGRPEVRGLGAVQTLTATVAADPCRLFEGRTTLVWIKVL